MSGQNPRQGEPTHTNGCPRRLTWNAGLRVLSASNLELVEATL